MTTWTSEADVTGEYFHIGASLYVVADYVILGYFAEEDVTTTWTPESDLATSWSPI